MTVREQLLFTKSLTPILTMQASLRGSIIMRRRSLACGTVARAQARGQSGSPESACTSGAAGQLPGDIVAHHRRAENEEPSERMTT